jgi:hypothetical protein
MENQQPDEQLSHEELILRKEEMLKFYTDSLPYLEAQLKYEKLLCEIDEFRFKRTQIQMQYAMMMQTQQYEEESSDEENDSPIPDLEANNIPTGRKLKKN